MAELLASFLENLGLLTCDSGCCSTNNFKLKNINFCGFEELLNNKTKKHQKKNNEVNNPINIYSSKKSSSISKYYMDGCIKKENVIHNLESNSLHKSNNSTNCKIFMNNKNEEESNTVIDLDNEILIGNFHLNCWEYYYKPSYNDELCSINTNESNLEIHGMNRNSEEKIKSLKNCSNDLYNATINYNSLNENKTTDTSYNFINSEKNIKNTNVIWNDKYKNKKKNTFSYSTISTKMDSPLSHPVGSNKDAVSETSSEFFSVISSLKTNI